MNSETQTNETDLDSSFSNKWDLNEKDPSASSITEQVKQVAESALQQTGFVYEETSGLYYDYNSGYYYDGVRDPRLSICPMVNKYFNCFRPKVFITMGIQALIIITTNPVDLINSIVK